ncbi:MAG: phosphonate C-P lyase system protein PhnH [Pseudomonadota bacterium]
MTSDQQSFAGGFASPAHDSARAFRSIMNAMARPGSIEPLLGGQPPTPVSVAAGTLILTLCDPDTSIALKGEHDTVSVRNWITFHTSAPFAAEGEADFVLGTWEAIVPLAPYKVGTAEYPDRSATLIVEQAELAAAGAVLRGPGIKTQASLNLPDAVALEANHAQFPLGLDCFFCAADKVAALPRSTRCEEAA